MDILDNSMTKQLSYLDKNIPSEGNDLRYQFELLKERVFSKEKEAELKLNENKNEYERILKIRDEEVKSFLNNVVQENISLKHQLINADIEIALHKEEIEELIKANEGKHHDYNPKHTDDHFELENTKSILDKHYFNAIKLIEESHFKKQKEIEDKFTTQNKNLTKELREKSSFIKKIANENKHKYKSIDEDDFEYLTISQVEDQFSIFENKIKNYLTELNSRDKYISIMEQKYDLMNEENKFIKKKVKEEKQAIFDHLNEIQKEERQRNEETDKKIQEEIFNTKNSLHNKIDRNLENSEQIIKKITLEKEELKEKNSILYNHLTSIKNENKEILEENNKKMSEIRQLKNKIDSIYSEKQEYERLKMHYDEIKKLYIEEKSNVLSLELKISLLEEKIDAKHMDAKKIIDDYEKKKQTTMDKLSNFNSELEKNHPSTIPENEKLKYITIIKLKDEELEKYEQDIKGLNLKLRDYQEKLMKAQNNNYNNNSNKIISPSKDKDISDYKDHRDNNNSSIASNSQNHYRDIHIFKEKENSPKKDNSSSNRDYSPNTNNLIERYKEEIADLKNTMKLISQEREEDKKFREKYEKLNINMSTANEKMNEELAKVRERLIQSDTEAFSLNQEVERIMKQKNDLIVENDDLTKKNMFLENTMLSMKNGHSVDVARLKNHITDLEKMTEKVHKVHILENANNENRKDLRDLHSKIKKLYTQFHSKLYGPTKTITLHDENKMLEEIELNFDNLINKNKEVFDKEIEKIKSEGIKDKEEIKNLRKKVFLPSSNQGTGQGGQGSGLSPNSDFNQIVKDKTGEASLYESIIIHIKTLNVKYLLEIFDLNIQREEEVRNILSEKHKGKSNLLEYKNKALEMMKNFDGLKNYCEGEIKVYEERSKMYVPPEELEAILDEYKNFTQHLLDLLLNTLMSYKTEDSDFIVFKMPINSYNDLIEKVSENLDNFTKNVNQTFESYEKMAVKVVKAVDFLNKQTAVNYDVLEKIVNHPFATKFI